MKKIFLKMKSGLKKLFKIIQKPSMLILPGQVAFSLFLSIFPIITLIGFIASKFNVSLVSLLEWLGQVLPKNISEFLLIKGSNNGINIVMFTILGFFIASNGPWSILVASNTIYEEPQDNPIKRRIKAIIMTVILVFMFIVIAVILAFGNQIMKYLVSIETLEFITRTLYNIFAFIKWPVMALFIFFSVKIIYTMLTPPRVTSRTTNLGSLFTTLAWIIITAIYSYYVTNIADYGLFYGSMSSIIVFMIWVYMLAYVLVIGICINSAVYISNKEKQTELEKKV